MLAMAADTGNSEPLLSLWWLMDVRCYIKALSMNHFVQDKFQSTNTEDKFKHIQYMSKHTHTHGKRKNISSTHLTNTSKTY